MGSRQLNGLAIYTAAQKDVAGSPHWQAHGCREDSWKAMGGRILEWQAPIKTRAGNDGNWHDEHHPRTHVVAEIIAKAAVQTRCPNGGSFCVIGASTTAYSVDYGLGNASWGACENSVAEVRPGTRLFSFAKSGASLGAMCYQSQDAAEFAAKEGITRDAVLAIGGRNSDTSNRSYEVGEENEEWRLRDIAQALIPHVARNDRQVIKVRREGGAPMPKRSSPA